MEKEEDTEAPKVELPESGTVKLEETNRPKSKSHKKKARTKRPRAHQVLAPVQPISSSSSSSSSMTTSSNSDGQRVHNRVIRTTGMPTKVALRPHMIRMPSRRSTRPVPVGPLQLPAKVYLSVPSPDEPGKRKKVYGILMYCDSSSGQHRFLYMNQSLNAMTIFKFDEQIYTRPTRVDREIRGSKTGKGWHNIYVANKVLVHASTAASGTRKSRSRSRSRSPSRSASRSCSSPSPPRMMKKNHKSTITEKSKRASKSKSKKSKSKSKSNRESSSTSAGHRESTASEPDSPVGDGHQHAGQDTVKARYLSLNDFRCTTGFRNDPSITIEQRDAWCRTARDDYNKSAFVTVLSEIQPLPDETAIQVPPTATKMGREENSSGPNCGIHLQSPPLTKKEGSATCPHDLTDRESVLLPLQEEVRMVSAISDQPDEFISSGWSTVSSSFGEPLERTFDLCCCNHAHPHHHSITLPEQHQHPPSRLPPWKFAPIIPTSDPLVSKGLWEREPFHTMRGGKAKRANAGSGGGGGGSGSPTNQPTMPNNTVPTHHSHATAQNAGPGSVNSHSITNPTNPTNPIKIETDIEYDPRPVTSRSHGIPASLAEKILAALQTIEVMQLRIPPDIEEYFLRLQSQQHTNQRAGGASRRHGRRA